MQGTRWGWKLGAAVAASALLAACGASSSPAKPSGAAAPSGAKGAPIKVGLLTPLTGTYALFGKVGLDGVELAIDQANAQGGIHGHPVQLLWKDYQSSSSQAVTDFYSLAGNGVIAVLGPLDSPAGEAVEPVAERLGIPTIAEVSDPIVVLPAKPDFFSVVPLPQYFSTPLVQWFQYKGYKKLAIAYDTTDAWAFDGAKAMEQQAQKAGMQVVGTYPFEITTNDFGPMLAKLQSSGAQVFAVWGTGNAEVILTKQFASLGLNKHIQLVMNATEASPAYTGPAGAAANGVVLDGPVVLLSQYLPASSPFKQGLDAFTQAYTKKFGEAPQIVSIQSYALAQILLQALRQAPTLTPAGVDAALNHMNVETVDGRFTFAPNQHGSVSDPNQIAVLRIENGQFVPTQWEKQRFNQLGQ
ncbi:MAG: ABC transporter substrate-binding protein [Firmicutes bacterium]|nr:ABC transporter substrate-binding protein [Alicyclobacillaceae bacterium]MCL6498296.1 ABC transporter substrate-binding protein [Bacillota bacterium]